MIHIGSLIKQKLRRKKVGENLVVSKINRIFANETIN